jgi:hypothetical protein
MKDDDNDSGLCQRLGGVVVGTAIVVTTTVVVVVAVVVVVVAEVVVVVVAEVAVAEALVVAEVVVVEMVVDLLRRLNPQNPRSRCLMPSETQLAAQPTFPPLQFSSVQDNRARSSLPCTKFQQRS